MNFKNLLLAYLVAGMPIHCNATFKENVKDRYNKAQTFVQHNYHQIVKTAAGSLSLLGGSCVALHGINTIIKTPHDLDRRDMGAVLVLGSALSAMYCGYLTINTALDNKINTCVKSILARSKTR